MEFNAKKRKVLRVARIRSIDDRDYYLGGIKSDRVDVEKDLGILVSHNLSWNNHVVFYLIIGPFMVTFKIILLHN